MGDVDRQSTAFPVADTDPNRKPNTDMDANPIAFTHDITIAVDNACPVAFTYSDAYRDTNRDTFTVFDPPPDPYADGIALANRVWNAVAKRDTDEQCLRDGGRRDAPDVGRVDTAGDEQRPGCSND